MYKDNEQRCLFMVKAFKIYIYILNMLFKTCCLPLKPQKISSFFSPCLSLLHLSVFIKAESFLLYLFVSPFFPYPTSLFHSPTLIFYLGRQCFWISLLFRVVVLRCCFFLKLPFTSNDGSYTKIDAFPCGVVCFATLFCRQCQFGFPCWTQIQRPHSKPRCSQRSWCSSSRKVSLCRWCPSWWQWSCQFKWVGFLSLLFILFIFCFSHAKFFFSFLDYVWFVCCMLWRLSPFSIWVFDFACVICSGCIIPKLGLALLWRTSMYKLIQGVTFCGWIVLAAQHVLRKAVLVYVSRLNLQLQHSCILKVLMVECIMHICFISTWIRAIGLANVGFTILLSCCRWT